VDGTSSSRQWERLNAFARLRQIGVFLTTTESLLFQILGDASNKDFKAISNLIKAHADAKIDPQLDSASL